jgi:hypothetical protein
MYRPGKIFLLRWNKTPGQRVYTPGIATASPMCRQSAFANAAIATGLSPQQGVFNGRANFRARGRMRNVMRSALQHI